MERFIVTVLVFILVFIVLGVLEGIFLELALEVDYKKHSLFYKYIVKRFYNFDED